MVSGIVENRVIIAGSREFNDYEIAEKAISEAFRSIAITGPVRIVSGHCRGVDILGEKYADKYGLTEELLYEALKDANLPIVITETDINVKQVATR